MKYGIDKQIISVFKDILQKSHESTITESEVFKIIAALDTKYENNPYYLLGIDGVICNIGADIKSVNLLNYAISRLKHKIDFDKNNKLLFDLGNCICTLGDLACPYPYSIKMLLDTDKYNEARQWFHQVEKDVNTSFERAKTNTANILEKYGRNFEAIYIYDEVLKQNPGFGMAIGNKAKAIDYYIRLSPHKSYRLMRIVVSLLEKALSDSSIIEVGGPLAKLFFEEKKKTLSEYLVSCNELHKKEKKRFPFYLSKYNNFCLNRNLFLNYDFGFYYDKLSLEDSFFPSFVDEISTKQSERNNLMSEKVYFSFQVYNQILENYSTSRFLLFNILENDFSEIDKKVLYTYTFDYTRHGYKYGILKNVFCTLYNCLDKIGHLIYYYFVEYDQKSSKKIYFNWLLKDSFKDIIIKTNNFQLLALRNLALDFEEGYQYYYLNKIRNRITHSFMNINEGIVYNKNFSSYEITEEALIKAVDKMLLITKASIMYSVIAITSIKPDGNLFHMDATLENQIYY